MMRLAQLVQRKARRQRRRSDRWRNDARHQDWMRSPSGQPFFNSGDVIWNGMMVRETVNLELRA